MALDAFLTKSIAVNSAASFYPTGAVAVGGSAVDEIYYLGPNLSQPLFLVIHVPSVSGTSPTLGVDLEFDSTAAFSSAKTVDLGHTNINAAGTYVISPGIIQADPDNPYMRIKLTAGGTSPDFGTVTASLTPDLPNSRTIIA